MENRILSALLLAVSLSWCQTAAAQSSFVPPDPVPVASLPPIPPTKSLPPTAVVPANAPAAPLYTTQQPPLATADQPGRGLLQQPSAPRNFSEPFIPYMLGDFVGPLGNLFDDTKIAECESPRPVDRAYFRFNYFNNLAKPRWADPTETIHNVHLCRYVLGVEKTFFDEVFSLGLRLPFYTISAEGKEIFVTPQGTLGQNADGLETGHLGNIAVIMKLLLWEDRATGSVLSAGAITSFPTASSRLINPGQSTTMFLQPFTGFIYAQGDFFVQGFASVTLPIIRPPAVVLFADVGVGYFAYRDNGNSGLVTAIVPTLELHLGSPLRQNITNVEIFGIVDNQRVHNTLNMTVGTTVELAHQATLGLGMSLPFTGPKPFDYEFLAQLNYRF